jgi:hypothetical protein
MKKLYIFIILVLVFASCEKVIEVDLNEANPRIVVDGNIDFKDQKTTGNAFVQLHWTSSFYESNSFETIENAQVKLTDTQGKIYNLSHSSNGYYLATGIHKGQIGEEYKLEVLVDGKTLKSKTTLARSVKIDSLSYTLDNFGPHQGGGYMVNCHFTDPAGEVNYYYLKLFIDNIPCQGFFITRDDGLDGKAITYTFFRNLIEGPNDVTVVLYTLDEASFEYFKVLAMMDQGGMSTAPGNPPSNIEGDAIGLFRAEYMDIQSIQIP